MNHSLYFLWEIICSMASLIKQIILAYLNALL